MLQALQYNCATYAVTYVTARASHWSKCKNDSFGDNSDKCDKYRSFPFALFYFDTIAV